MDPDTVPREMFDLAMTGVYTLAGVVATVVTAAWAWVRADKQRSIEDHKRKDELIAKLSERVNALEARR